MHRILVDALVHAKLRTRSLDLRVRVLLSCGMEYGSAVLESSHRCRTRVSCCGFNLWWSRSTALHPLILKSSLPLNIVAILLVVCAQKQLVAPSGGAVTGGISRSQSAASTAQQQQKDIVAANLEAQRTASRIDAKDKFIEGYRKWKLSHP